MSLATALRHTRIRNPEKIAIAFGHQSWTYAKFDQLTDDIARNLIVAGLKPGDRVAFRLQNGPELALGYFGCLKAGCIAVPINMRLKGPEIDYILRHSGAVCYVGQPLHADVAGASSALAALDLLFLEGQHSTNQVKSFSDLLQPAPSALSLPQIDSDQMAAILYTSGTTARPKGVTHTHESLAQTARAMRQMHLGQNQVAIIMSSMAHMVGFGMMFLSGLLNGATIVITVPFDFKSVLESYAEWGSTYTVGLPVMFHGLLQTQTEMPRKIPPKGFYFCGGDSVSPALQEAFQDALGPVCEVYGLTEIAPAVWNQAGHARIGSIGKPDEGIRVRLVDSRGCDVRRGEVGEICIQGLHMMSGYWQDPDATAAAIPDGWFHTGDLASCDAEGFYWFAGRKKEIIIRGGSNISPQEVEAVLYQHSAIREAAVIGRPDPVWGERVVAFVVLRSGHSVTEPELIRFARMRMADYKTPESVIFRAELPKGPSGKIQRRALREEEYLLTAQG